MSTQGLLQGTRRALVLCATIGLLLPLGGGAEAVQADATLRVEKQGWFWRQARTEQVEPPACPDPSSGVPCPSQKVEPAPQAYEQDHFLVGYDGSQPEDLRDQAYALFQFDMSWIAPGTKVHAGSLVLEESNDDATHRNRRPSHNVNSDAGGTKLRVCLVTDFWGGSQPGLWGEIPSVDCAKASGDGERTEKQLEGRTIPIWTFDIKPIAQEWAKAPFSNFGLAVMPAEGASGTFQVSFHGDTRIINQDPVTRREEVESLQRVFGTMRFEAERATVSDPTPPASSATGDTGGTGISVTPVLGSPTTSFGSSPTGAGDGSAVPDVNTDVQVRGRRTPVAYTAQTPAYVFLAFPIGLALSRLLALLFVRGSGAPRENRVAAAYRRMSATS